MGRKIYILSVVKYFLICYIVISKLIIKSVLTKKIIIMAKIEKKVETVVIGKKEIEVSKLTAKQWKTLGKQDVKDGIAKRSDNFYYGKGRDEAININKIKKLNASVVDQSAAMTVLKRM